MLPIWESDIVVYIDKARDTKEFGKVMSCEYLQRAQMQLLRVQLATILFVGFSHNFQLISRKVK